MKKKDKRPPYEPPLARDLSILSVRGDGPSPLGVCTSGLNPWNECAAGTAAPPPADCTVGDVVGGGGEPCVDGGFASWPVCGDGSIAATVCAVGSGHG